MGDRYSLDAECSNIFPIIAARSMRSSAKWDRPRDVCAYANREWKMRTRLRKGETGERSEVTGLRGYAVTRPSPWRPRPSASFVPDIVTLLKQGRTRKKKKKNGDENEKRH